MGAFHHSAAIHIPLALAVLFPFFYAVSKILVRVGFVPAHIWVAQWGVCLIQLVSGALAYATGQRDMTLSPADPEQLAQHLELAKIFMAIWVGVFIAVPLANWSSGKIKSIVFHAVLLVLMLAQLVVAVKLGQLGGKLVYGS